jgi:hypothetical protein
MRGITSNSDLMSASEIRENLGNGRTDAKEESFETRGRRKSASRHCTTVSFAAAGRLSRTSAVRIDQDVINKRKSVIDETFAGDPSE